MSLSSTESPAGAALFSPFRLGATTLANRIVMAPLTRNRALPGVDVPHQLNAAYYAQRSGAGLIIAEATQISPVGKGYAWTPGIYSAEQVAGWRLVTNAVHARGGKIFLQLWHVGRISHPSLQPGGKAPVAPSAIAPEGQQTFIEDGTFAPIGTPRALELDEIAATIDDFRRATRNALDAGFDGVEIHAANGYLIDQFLRDGANARTDAYGGSPLNRIRFATEVIAAVSEIAGPERTGIRISPVTPFGDLKDSDPAAVFVPLVDAIDRAGLAYVHVIEGATGGARDFAPFDYAALRTHFHGAWIVNNGYTAATATDAIESGYADLVAFGRPFVANPDLVERLRDGAPLADVDQATLYGGGAAGYTDYPALETASA